MNTTLYNIQENYLALMESIEENEGVLTDEQVAQLAIHQTELKTKGKAYLEVIKSREAFVSTIDEEIKRLQALKKRNNNLVSTLKDRLLEAVKLFGDFQAGTLTFTTRKSTSVLVEDVNSLPKEYKVIKVTESADKLGLKSALKKGEQVEGVSLETKLNLSIK